VNTNGVVSFYMVNVIENYKRLLRSYAVASQCYQDNGDTHLLRFTLEELEAFERSFIEHYSIEKLMEFQTEYNSQLITYEVM
jgi:hypothetical protein